MTFNKFRSDSYCVGGRHRSATLQIYGDVSSKGNKVLIGFCSICIRKKSMKVSEDTTKAKSLGDFFKNLGKNGLSVSKKRAKKRFKSPKKSLRFNSKNSCSSCF